MNCVQCISDQPIVLLKVLSRSVFIQFNRFDSIRPNYISIGLSWLFIILFYIILFVLSGIWLERFIIFIFRYIQFCFTGPESLHGSCDGCNTGVVNLRFYCPNHTTAMYILLAIALSRLFW